METGQAYDALYLIWNLWTPHIILRNDCRDQLSSAFDQESLDSYIILRKGCRDQSSSAFDQEFLDSSYYLEEGMQRQSSSACRGS